MLIICVSFDQWRVGRSFSNIALAWSGAAALGCGINKKLNFIETRWSMS